LVNYFTKLFLDVDQDLEIDIENDLDLQKEIEEEAQEETEITDLVHQIKVMIPEEKERETETKIAAQEKVPESPLTIREKSKEDTVINAIDPQ